jgi:hypothetical protein
LDFPYRPSLYRIPFFSSLFPFYRYRPKSLTKQPKLKDRLPAYLTRAAVDYPLSYHSLTYSLTKERNKETKKQREKERKREREKERKRERNKERNKETKKERKRETKRERKNVFAH